MEAFGVSLKHILQSQKIFEKSSKSPNPSWIAEKSPTNHRDRDRLSRKTMPNFLKYSYIIYVTVKRRKSFHIISGFINKRNILFILP